MTTGQRRLPAPDGDTTLWIDERWSEDRAVIEVRSGRLQIWTSAGRGYLVPVPLDRVARWCVDVAGDHTCALRLSTDAGEYVVHVSTPMFAAARRAFEHELGALGTGTESAPDTARVHAGEREPVEDVPPVQLDLRPGMLNTLPAQLSRLDERQVRELLRWERRHEDRFPIVECLSFRLSELAGACVGRAADRRMSATRSGVPRP